MSTEIGKENDTESMEWLEELIEFIDEPEHGPDNVQSCAQAEASQEWADGLALISADLKGIKFAYTEEQKQIWRNNNRWRRGYERSEEDRRKISQGHQRRKEEGKKRAPVSTEVRRRLSRKMKDKFAAGYQRPSTSEEARAKMREAHAARKKAGLGRKNTNWNIAKEKAKLTRKMNALLGIERKPVSEDAKQKLKEAWIRLKQEGYMRKPVSEEGRANMSAAQLKRYAEKGGIKHTEASKKKMSEAYATRIASGWKPPKRTPESIAKGLETKKARKKLKEERATATQENIQQDQLLASKNT